MDAFSVSIANAIAEPKMRRFKMYCIAGVYAFFQFAMPMAGWICVRTIVEFFSGIQKYLPVISLLLLAWIGGKMIFESAGKKEEKVDVKNLTPGVLFVQGIATSIDALSVGFAIEDETFLRAIFSSMIIAAVTFVICMSGLFIGKKAGEKFSFHAELVGGIILVGIGIEIFVRGFILGL